MAESTKHPNIVETAVAYAKHGWPVIPLHSPNGSSCDCGNPQCQSPAKHPWTTRGLKDASTDENEIRDWWKRWPNANVGLPIPQGYVVLDVDGEDGSTALKTYALPETAIAETGKGWHYVYRTRIEIRPKVNLFPSVDIRGPGSYIVAPPSLHVSGKRYTWLINMSHVAECPEWLYDAIKARGRLDLERARFKTADILSGVPEGQRDSALFRLASKFRWADVPVEMAEQLVIEAAGKCTPPFPADLARQKVLGAYGRYEASKVISIGASDVTTAPTGRIIVSHQTASGPIEFVFDEIEKTTRGLEADMEVRLLLAGTEPEPYSQRINLLSVSSREACRRELESIYGKDQGWAKLLNVCGVRVKQAYLDIDRSDDASSLDAPAEVEFVVDCLIPENGVTILFGSGSSAKTFLAMTMAIAVAQGAPWLGHATQKRKALIIDYETGRDTFAYRLRRLLRAQDSDQDEIRGSLRYWWASGIPLLDQVDAICRAIERHGIGFVILDHCALACGGEPEKAESAMRFYRACTKIGLPMLVIAHVTGEVDRDPSLAKRPFGSVYFSNSARRTWFVQRAQLPDSDTVEIGLYCRKVNDGPLPKDMGITITFDGKSGPIYIARTDIRESRALQDARIMVDRLFDALDNPKTTQELADELGVGSTSVRVTLNRYRDRRFVQVAYGQGKGLKWARLAPADTVTPGSDPQRNA